MRYWLGLGANVGDRRATIDAALGWLAAATRLEAVSPAYETAPRDLEDQPPFLNAAARVETPLEPPALLAEVKRLERELGPGSRAACASGPARSTATCCCGRAGRGATTTLEVPHPRLAERRFALLPLLDLDPGLSLPDGRSLADLEAALDPLEQPAKRLAEPLARPRSRGGGEL